MDDDRQAPEQAGAVAPARPPHLRPVPDATPDGPDDDAADAPDGDVAHDDDVASVDPLLEQVRGIEDLPVGERAQAFESLNRRLVTALNELEQL